MDQLLSSLWQLVLSMGQVLVAVGQLVTPWLPLILLVLVSLLAVDWRRAWPVLVSGGWIGIVILGVTIASVWNFLHPMKELVQPIDGLTLQSWVIRVVETTACLLIMLACAGWQLSGFHPKWLVPEERNSEWE